MIGKVSDSAGVAPAADLTQKTAATKTHRHTPFGDVMVDELAPPNLAGVFLGGRSHARRAHTAVAATTGQAGVAATPVQSAAVASTVNAAVAATDSQAADSSSAPTAQSVFGSQPWLAAPTGSNPDGTQFGYNPIYFATRQTAEQIAAMVGGQVVEQNAIAPNGTMRQQVPNEMIQLANGSVVNAGLIADFYDHGYPQSYIDMLIQNEIRGA